MGSAGWEPHPHQGAGGAWWKGICAGEDAGNPVSGSRFILWSRTPGIQKGLGANLKSRGKIDLMRQNSVHIETDISRQDKDNTSETGNQVHC